MICDIIARTGEHEELTYFASLDLPMPPRVGERLYGIHKNNQTWVIIVTRVSYIISPNNKVIEAEVVGTVTSTREG